MHEVFKVKFHNNYHFLLNISEKILEENIKLNWQVLLIVEQELGDGRMGTHHRSLFVCNFPLQKHFLNVTSCFIDEPNEIKQNSEYLE